MTQKSYVAVLIKIVTICFFLSGCSCENDPDPNDQEQIQNITVSQDQTNIILDNEYDFGGSAVPREITFVIKNEGNYRITPEVDLSGEDISLFNVSQQPGSIEAGENKSFKIMFNPQGNDEYVQVTVSIKENDSIIHKYVIYMYDIASVATINIEIDGISIYDRREGSNRLIRGIAWSGLEYDKPYIHNELGEVQMVSNYPGNIGINFFKPDSGDFIDIKTRGFSTVRIPFDIGRLVNGKESYSNKTHIDFNTAYLDFLKNSVVYARNNGLWIIFDMHNALEYPVNGTTVIKVNESEKYQNLLVQTWRQLASIFASSEAVLGYEIINEPNPHAGDSNWCYIAQRIVDSVREIDTEKVLFIDGANWSGAPQWSTENQVISITDTASRVVYAPHLYLDNDGNGLFGLGVENGPSTTALQSVVRGKIENLISWAHSHNSAICILESGFPYSNDTWQGSMELLFHQYLNTFGIGYIYWTMDENEDQVTSYKDGNWITTVLNDNMNIVIDSSDNYSNYIYKDDLFYINGWSGAHPFDFPSTVNLSNTDDKCSGNFSIHAALGGTYSQNGFIITNDSEFNLTGVDNISFFHKSSHDFKVYTKDSGNSNSTNSFLISASPSSYRYEEIDISFITDIGDDCISGLGFQGANENIYIDLYLDDVVFK
ncbi:MAG: glycoside hydrolase family 5 protein [bacterium]|nr:glycoside hydrolase family 5 protein [bacterium]